MFHFFPIVIIDDLFVCRCKLNYGFALQMRYIVINDNVLSNLMSPKKITTLNLRVDPAIKEAIKVAANRDHRSVANMIEMLIRQHCEKESITIPEQHGLFKENE